MKIVIPFLEVFREPMLKGYKTWTSRTKKYGKAGDTFDIFGATFQLIEIRKMSLGEVAEHYKEEGFFARHLFIEIWRKLHYRHGYSPNRIVNVHIFKRI